MIVPLHLPCGARRVGTTRQCSPATAGNLFLGCLTARLNCPHVIGPAMGRWPASIGSYLTRAPIVQPRTDPIRDFQVCPEWVRRRHGGRVRQSPLSPSKVVGVEPVVGQHQESAVPPSSPCKEEHPVEADGLITLKPRAGLVNRRRGLLAQSEHHSWTSMKGLPALPSGDRRR